MPKRNDSSCRRRLLHNEAVGSPDAFGCRWDAEVRFGEDIDRRHFQQPDDTRHADSAFSGRPTVTAATRANHGENNQ